VIKYKQSLSAVRDTAKTVTKTYAIFLVLRPAFAGLFFAAEGKNKNE
jgi:hypothetical protein